MVLFLHLQQTLVSLSVLSSGLSDAISGDEGLSWISSPNFFQLTSSISTRWSFNLTLLITGIFGLAAGGSNSFITLASLLAVVGVGVGGNMPVDSAVFLGMRAFRPAPFIITLML